jgi:hypothetical protein
MDADSRQDLAMVAVEDSEVPRDYSRVASILIAIGVRIANHDDDERENDE